MRELLCTRFRASKSEVVMPIGRVRVSIGAVLLPVAVLDSIPRWNRAKQAKLNVRTVVSKERTSRAWLATWLFATGYVFTSFQDICARLSRNRLLLPNDLIASTRCECIRSVTFVRHTIVFANITQSWTSINATSLTFSSDDTMSIASFNANHTERRYSYAVTTVLLNCTKRSPARIQVSTSSISETGGKSETLMPAETRVAGSFYVWF